ncbi:MAG TPA: primosomal protein N' [Anaerolineales bacterium]|jgi:primosomal protein N' (replication factor Y)
MKFVRVAVNLPAVSGEFDYHLPPALEGLVAAGHLVLVPFGSQTVQGVVLEVLGQAEVTQTKSVLDLLDPAPVLTPAQIEAARQLAAETLNPLSAILDLMLPPGLSQHADVLFSLSAHWQVEDASQLPPVQKRLVELLQNRGPLRGRQIDRHFQRVDWRKSAQFLLRQAVLERQSVLPPPTVRPKFILTAQLAVTPEEAQAAIPALGKTTATLARRQKALQFLIDEPESVAVTWVYAQSGCNLADLQELAERELIILLESEIFRDPLEKLSRREAAGLPQAKTSLELTPEQESALVEITRSLQPGSSQAGVPARSYLLYGVTGSGKTEIYLRAAAEAIRLRKSAIILVPEIAITPQIVRRFLAHFPGNVGLVHSKLSEGERYDTWRRARSGKLKVIIGPRSALFSPLPNLGLIVVDECHDNSYYQQEPPFYNAVKAAELIARVNGAVCVMGSATPSVELRYRSLQAGTSLHNLELSQRFQTDTQGGKLGELPPVAVIDMREELVSGNRGIFSRSLLEALALTLERGEQAILYLNRRGTATYVFCRTCGYVVKCPRCDAPLTQHEPASPDLALRGRTGLPGNLPGLVCHRCGYTRQMPDTCPNCKRDQIRAYGLGSEKVEKELKALLPKARSLRWDWETTREKDAHELILTHFANHQADVLVGTQMLAKGLDLPLVTLVGIVLADVGLTLPDPFAAERTFQLLTQVAGRAGRSARGGRVVMQTFMPENPVIQFASRHDYGGFYRWEIDNRQKLGYPPFEQVMRLEYRHLDNAVAEEQARSLATRLDQVIVAENRKMTSLIGPAPCFFSRLNGYYRWQVLVRGPQPAGVLRGQLPDGWRVEVEPASLL